MTDRHLHLLEIASKVSETCEVLSVDTASSGAVMGSSGTVVLEESADRSRGIRLIRNGRTGIAGATSMVDDSVLVDLAIADARTGPEENLLLPDSVQPSDVILYDSELADVDGSSLASLLLELRGNLESLSPYASMTGSMELQRRRISLCNSRGLSCGYEKLLLDWRLRFSFPTGDGFFSTGMSASSGRMDFDPAAIAREAALLGRWSTSAVTAPGTGPVLFLPSSLSVLLQAVRTGVSGRSLVNGSSPLTGHVGSSVLSGTVTLSDLPLLDMGGASAPFDAEGVATRNKVLFERGIFRGFVFDLLTASESGTQSTGNAGRNLDRKPEPVCTNLVMDAGDTTREEMITSMESGVIVTDILSGEGSNASTGDFSFDSCNVLAVEGGEVAGRAPGVLIRGNVYTILNNVSGIGGRLTRVGSDLFPAIITGGITISQA